MARLLFVSQPTVGGVAVHVAALARHACLAGHTVSIASPNGGDLPRWGKAAGARHFPLEMTRGVDAAEVLRLRELRLMVSSADLVHLHSSKAGAIGRVVLKTLRGDRPPSIFTPHGWSWLVGGKAMHLYQMIERSLAPETDTIIAVSDWEAQEGRRVLGENAKITTIPNGIDLSKFQTHGPIARTKCKQVVLVVGRLTRAKGQDLTLQAAARLKHMDVEFRFLGAGEDEAKLRALSTDLALENVTFLGQGEPAPHYRSADLVLVPSRWDACPLVLLESLACGTPVLASDGVGVAGAIREHIHRLTSLEPTTIASAVESLLTDDRLRRRGLSDGTDLVRSSWSEIGQIQETLDLYTSLLS